MSNLLEFRTILVILNRAYRLGSQFRISKNPAVSCDDRDSKPQEPA